MSKQENVPSFPQFVIARIVEQRVGFGLTFLGVGVSIFLVGMRSPIIAFLKTFFGE